MRNTEIIMEAINLSGLANEVKYDELKSYKAWELEGYKVRKGEKALMQVDLWIPCRRKDKVKKENGEEAEVKSNYFRMRKTSLFHKSQVDKIEEVA